MRKAVVLSLLLALCLSQTAPAAETSADVITHVKHDNPSQYFTKGRELYEAHKYTESMITLKKAVEEGDAWAAALIGAIYANGGDGIERSTNNAVKWYNKATEMGYPASDAFFAMRYYYGDGVPKNDKKAYQLIHGIENLVLEDDDIIPNIASLFYMRGIGTPKDMEKARLIANRIKSDKIRQAALSTIDEAVNGIPAKELLSEVGKNQMRFDKRYKGRQITTSGFVGKIDERKGGYTLSLFGEQGLVNPFNHIECRFKASEEDKLLDLNQGDAVRIKGTYKGKEAFQIGALILHNCIISD
ncbi:MAG: SEL1-like repeat protein [Synergistaceae bacterium]|nr:SEL1-like repeat protein [Synergistaceae bacterium]